MRSNLTYEVSRKDFDYVTKKYNTTIESRDACIMIYGKSEIEVREKFDSLEIYIQTNSNYYFSSCPAIEQINEKLWYYADSINVHDKDEYDEIKELYKEWKQSMKNSR